MSKPTIFLFAGQKSHLLTNGQTDRQTGGQTRADSLAEEEEN